MPLSNALVVAGMSTPVRSSARLGKREREENHDSHVTLASWYQASNGSFTRRTTFVVCIGFVDFVHGSYDRLSSVNMYKSEVRAAIRSEAADKNKSFKKYTGDAKLEFRVQLKFQVPAGEEHLSGKPYIGHDARDVDVCEVLQVVKGALRGIVYESDMQMILVRVSKIYSLTDCIDITISDHALQDFCLFT